MLFFVWLRLLKTRPLLGLCWKSMSLQQSSAFLCRDAEDCCKLIDFQHKPRRGLVFRSLSQTKNNIHHGRRTISHFLRSCALQSLFGSFLCWFIFCTVKQWARDYQVRCRPVTGSWHIVQDSYSKKRLNIDIMRKRLQRIPKENQIIQFLISNQS